MSELCNVRLVLYTEKENGDNLRKGVDKIFKGVDFFKVDVLWMFENKKSLMPENTLYFELFGTSNKSLDYDAVNALTKEFSLKWASLENNPERQMFIKNDEVGYFKNENYEIIESNCELDGIYNSKEKIVEILEDILLRESKAEVLKRIFEELENYGSTFLNYEEVESGIFRDEDEFFFNIYEYQKNESNFWWKESEE